MLEIKGDPSRVRDPEYLKPAEIRYATLAESETELTTLPAMRPPRSPEQKAAMIAELEKQLGMKSAEAKT